MDSTLLDQIRHLCRDRAAYERLKAILVQQERVHQLSWEERYAKLMSDSEAQGTDAFSNIIAREKALAQLAEAMQRSPSLDLVLQIAVQVAQKLLQVDRVAIFRRYPDERGEFITDAIAAGVMSLAEMPERQHSLTRHIIESSQIEDSDQTFNSISNSSLSTHSINLLEQIGISSYAANKIYTGQELWGIIVAFHGSSYHSWAESDRTSLSLISAQIGIAISLSKLRQHSQNLANDLQVLQLEVNNLQQTVNEIATAERAKAEIVKAEIDEDVTQPLIKSPITPSASPIIKVESESIINTVVQYLVDSNYQNDSVISNPELSNPKLDDVNLEPTQENQDLEEESSPEEEKLEIINQEQNEDLFDTQGEAYEYLPIPENGLPPRFLVSDFPVDLYNAEEIEAEAEAILEEIEPEDSSAIETLPLFVDEINIPRLETYEPILSEFELVALGLAGERVNVPEEVETLESVEQIEELELNAESSQEAIASETIVPEESKAASKLEAASNLEAANPENSELIETAPEAIALEPVLTPNELENPQTSIDASQSGISPSAITESDLEPVIEPEFIETILMLAGNGRKATEFLINVIDAYLQDAPNLLWEIDKAIAIHSEVQIFQSLNTLRSSSDYIGALTLSQECRQLESAVRANNVELTAACLSRLEIEVERATDALRIERSRYSSMNI